MRVEFLIEGDDDVAEWRNAYILDNLITGFYAPDYDEELGECLNVFYNGQTFTFKSNSILLEYLQKNFVDAE